MTSDKTIEARLKRRERLARMPGVKTLSRPLPDGRTLPLAYARSGPRTARPVLVFPGGPGLASVIPYGALRARAVKQGLDMMLIEHRGVGMSRAAEDGIDIPAESVTIGDVVDDAIAVLDAEGIEQVLVYGSSYGSYLAQCLGAAHPERVAGMILDSAMLDASSQQAATRHVNDLFWRGTPQTARHAERLRSLADRGRVDPPQAAFPVQFLFEFGGLPAVDAMLALLERGKGRRVWRWIERLGNADVTKSRPFVMEFDLVGRIAFTELDYGAPHDPSSGPLSNGSMFTELAGRFPAFGGEPYDLRRALPQFDWPLVVLSGDRDIRTPPSTAQDIVALAPNATLVPLAGQGHSALDTAPGVALQAMRAFVDGLGDGSARASLEDWVPDAGGRHLMGTILSARLRLAQLLPPPLS